MNRQHDERNTDHFDLLPFIAILMCVLGCLLLVTLSVAALSLGVGAGEGWIPVPDRERAAFVITTWDYKWDDPAIRHIGPMAQDFAAAFGVGEDDKHICPVDAQGVALAAIQGLYRIVEEKDARMENLEDQLRRQQEENRALLARVEALERNQDSGQNIRRDHPHWSFQPKAIDISPEV